MISLSRGHLRFQARFDCFEMHQLCSLRDVLAVVVRSSVNVSVRCLVRQARFTPATKYSGKLLAVLHLLMCERKYIGCSIGLYLIPTPCSQLTMSDQFSC